MSAGNSTDPRCPACGEPVTATSVYCMHCGEEFGDDGPRPATPDDGAGVSDADDVGLGESTGAGGAARRTPADPGHGRRQAVTTGPEKASLALRFPVAFVISLPVTLVSWVIVLGATRRLDGSVALGLLGALFVASFLYLVRKPIPSDIAGDAFYMLGALLMLGPVVGFAFDTGRKLSAGVAVDPASLVGAIIAVEFVLAFPAALLFGIGYVGNWWAARKLGG